MRQAGVIAAAGIVALSQVERLAEDHARATSLAEAVEDRWPGSIDYPVETNIVVFNHPDTSTLIGYLRSRGVLSGTIAEGRMRLVTHLGIDDGALERAATALRDFS